MIAARLKCSAEMGCLASYPPIRFETDRWITRSPVKFDQSECLELCYDVDVMSDKIVFSSDPGWGKPGTPRQPEPVRLSFHRGTKGSGVTSVERLVMHPTLKDGLLAKLKKHLGCGGTLKDGRFEFQGDHREKLEKFLLADGYKVKRVGG